MRDEHGRAAPSPSSRTLRGHPATPGSASRPAAAAAAPPPAPPAPRPAAAAAAPAAAPAAPPPPPRPAAPPPRCRTHRQSAGPPHRPGTRRTAAVPGRGDAGLAPARLQGAAGGGAGEGAAGALPLLPAALLQLPPLGRPALRAAAPPRPQRHGSAPARDGSRRGTRPDGLREHGGRRGPTEGGGERGRRAGRDRGWNGGGVRFAPSRPGGTAVPRALAGCADGARAGRGAAVPAGSAQHRGVCGAVNISGVKGFCFCPPWHSTSAAPLAANPTGPAAA